MTRHCDSSGCEWGEFEWYARSPTLTSPFRIRRVGEIADDHAHVHVDQRTLEDRRREPATCVACPAPCAGSAGRPGRRHVAALRPRYCADASASCQFFLVRSNHVENRRGLAGRAVSEDTNGSIRGYPSLERMRAAVAAPANKLGVQGPWTVVLLPGLELCMTAHRRNANRRRFSTATRLHC